MVVEQAVMYGMELYWNGQEEMRRILQVWLNRRMRRILGGSEKHTCGCNAGGVGKGGGGMGFG